MKGKMLIALRTRKMQAGEVNKSGLKTKDTTIDKFVLLL